MGLLNFGKRLGKGALAGAGKGITKVGSSRGALAAIGIGALGMGIASEVGPAARDAALDFSMGDPNADAAFTGRKFSARYLTGSLLGGGVGGAMRISSPKDFLYENPMIPSSKGLYAGAGIAGAAVGTVAGGVLGSMAGKAVGGLIGNKIPFAKKISPIAGGIIGAGMGGSIGMLSPAIAGGIAAKSYIGDNQQFFNESPYAPRSSLATSSALNASGDIVLGMHNSRRGY